MSQGASPATAIEVAEALFSRDEFTLLFAESIKAREVDSPEEALFFAAEAEAKAARMPKIVKEACARHDKLAQLHAQALAAKADPMPLPAGEALIGEIGDLCDWIRNSEYGLWQTLPESPTWGQLSRLSKAWHAEQLARAADARSIEEAKLTSHADYDKLHPFAPLPVARWAPLIGRHERDGWEAVELMSQSELSEEGAAMGHCVSGYAPQCREGLVRIFSVRLNGERKCTLELRSTAPLSELKGNAQFSITQNRGKHNVAVSNSAALEFCEATRSAVQLSWRSLWTELVAGREARAVDLAAKIAKMRGGRPGASDKTAGFGAARAQG